MSFVAWEMICVKSGRIRYVVAQDSKHASDSRLLNMVLQDGWIQILQERHNLKHVVYKDRQHQRTV